MDRHKQFFADERKVLQGGPCSCLAKLSFEWRRRRNGYRLSVYYQVLGGMVFCGNLVTMILYFLITSRDFFKNYRCGSQAQSLIAMNFLAMMICTGTAGLFSILMSRVLLLFNNYPVSEFMSLGKCIDRLGCIAKWVPWLLIMCFIGWFTINVVNATWIFALPEQWCSRRWSLAGVTAVENCRSWYRGTGKCIDTGRSLGSAQSHRPVTTHY